MSLVPHRSIEKPEKSLVLSNISVTRLLPGWCIRILDRHFPQNGLRRSMASGAFWSFTGTVSSRFFMLVSSVIVARLIGKAGYGKWGLISVAAGMFAQFAGMGVATTASKHIAEFKHTDPAKAGRILSLVILIGFFSLISMSLVLLAASHLLANSVYRIPELFVPIMLSSIMLFFMVALVMAQGILRGFEDFRTIAVTFGIQGLVQLGLAWLFILWFGLEGLVVAVGLSHGLPFLFACRVIVTRCHEHKIHLCLRGIWQERVVIWRYCAPSLVISSMMGPSQMASQAIVARIPGGVLGLGGYTVAARWRELVAFIPMTVSQIILPTLSKLLGRKDYARMRKAIWINFSANVGIATVIGLPLAILSPWILGIYGPEFRQDWDIMVMFIGVGIMQAAGMTLAPVSTVMNKMWWRAGIHLIWAITLVGGSYLLVPAYGVRGFAWAMVATRLINTILYVVIAIVCMRSFRNQSDSI